MKPAILSVCAAAILAAPACNSHSPSESTTTCARPEREFHTAETKWLNDTAIQNAIVAQHTLYPYHFVTYSACLNELGEHDLGVLVDHYKNHPGPLNLRRGDAPAELHEARLNFITDRLAKAGIEIGAIEDGHPGGEGLYSEFILMILEQSYMNGGGDENGTGMSEGLGTGRNASANRGARIQ
jgi:hypothetical protein